jgi:hypothetical protein
MKKRGHCQRGLEYLLKVLIFLASSFLCFCTQMFSQTSKLPNEQRIEEGQWSHVARCEIGVCYLMSKSL